MATALPPFPLRPGLTMHHWPLGTEMEMLARLYRLDNITNMHNPLLQRRDMHAQART